MADNRAIDRQINDLVNEAELLMLQMVLPELTALTKAGALVVRLRELAEQAQQAGREGSAQHLTHVAETLEKAATKGPT